jgi:hypothetical protein
MGKSIFFMGKQSLFDLKITICSPKLTEYTLKVTVCKEVLKKVLEKLATVIDYS